MALGASALTLSCAAVPAHAGATLDDDGPYTAIRPGDRAATIRADATFSNLFSSWSGMDNGSAGTIAPAVYIPTGRPVAKLELTSNFGVRVDPFNGQARMHKGIDIPGPTGTPIYATADGVVTHAQRMNGYGNLVEIAHGNDMETRYGHLSRLLVSANQHVHRGQLIGLMGSTGRSTGSHLHYEIRFAGEAINPLPYVTGSERAIALNATPPIALGGPSDREESAAK
ncbi:MAG: M23 family metallopeptidase [Sphingobium sp.]